MKKIIALALCLVMMFSCFCACGNSDGGENTEQKTLKIGIQIGVGYAPIFIMQAQKFIDKYYGSEVNVEISQLDSGASVNEGLMSGTFDIGAMGLAPARRRECAGSPNFLLPFYFPLFFMD